MNQFDNPEDYAFNLLRRMTPEQAIKHVIDAHGLGGRLWRDTVRVLVDAAGNRA